MFKYQENLLEKKTVENRRHLRYPFNYTIKYAVVPEGTDSFSTGIICNISNSGICLYTSQSLSEGQEIIFKSILPTFFRKAVVRWSNNSNDRVWKSGLEFIQGCN